MADLEKALLIKDSNLSPMHPGTLYPLLNLAAMHARVGNTSTYENYAKRALETANKCYGSNPDHPIRQAALRLHENALDCRFSAIVYIVYCLVVVGSKCVFQLLFSTPFLRFIMMFCLCFFNLIISFTPLTPFAFHPPTFPLLSLPTRYITGVNFVLFEPNYMDVALSEMTQAVTKKQKDETFYRANLLQSVNFM